MSNQDDLEAKYEAMIENNVNVSETSDLKEFFILVAGVVGLCVFIFLGADFAAGVWLDNVSDKTQMKIENVLSYGVGMEYKAGPLESKYSEQLEFLNSMTPKIVRLNRRLRSKSDFKIYVDKSPELNAFVVPNGTIYFTQGMLNEVKDKEMLTFALAHELGHYAHRDHLKASGRQIIGGLVLTVLTSGQSQALASFVSDVSYFNSLSYSKNQEKNADLFANKVVLTLYGNNDSGVRFMEMIDKKQNMPEFVNYFSTHPSPQERINILKHNK